MHPVTAAQAEIPSPDVPPAGPPPGQPYSAGYVRYALVTLMLVYMLNFLDRQIVNILAEPIKREFRLHDWQLGVMTGLAFAIFYATLGLPIARLAERANRVWIIGAAITVWSGCTALCGLAGSYLQLLVARIGVGVGEAGCSPPAHSLISDYVPKAKRASSLAFYQLGGPAGTLLGTILGGVVASAFGWRAAFLLVGLPGLILAVVTVLTLREPRRLAARQRAQAGPAPTFLDAMRLLRRKPTFWLVCLASGTNGAVGYGQGAFIASFFLRNHNVELTSLAAELGLKPFGLLAIAIGVCSGIGGLLGTYGGGLVTDWAARRSPQGYVVVPAISSLMFVPLSVLLVLTPSFQLALGVFFVQMVVNAVWPGPLYAVCQSVVPPNTRATSSAIQMFMGNMIGLTLGPLIMGLLSDLYAEGLGMGSAQGLRYAMLSFYGVGLGGAALFWAARRHIARDLES